MSKFSRDAVETDLNAIPRNHLPMITDDNAFFWRAGEQGRLRFMRCPSCRHYIHPPMPICPRCQSREMCAETVSGNATVLTYTINRQAWERGLEQPYVIAIVGLDEQEGLRLTTNIVNCAIEDVVIGLRVQVVFDHREDVWLPLFEPLDARTRPR